MEIANDWHEWKWYESELKMENGKIISGLRFIAKSLEEARKKHKKLVEKVDVHKVIDDVNIKLVPESILKKYNLNNHEDYELFLQMNKQYKVLYNN